MKRNLLLTIVGVIIFGNLLQAQSISDKTNEITFGSRDKKGLTTSVPKIIWKDPVNEVLITKDGKINFNFSVESKQKLKTITLKIKYTIDSAKSVIAVPNENSFLMSVSRSITFPEGINELEVWAENIDGIRSISRKSIHSGTTTLADASKLKRTDYALIFATDTYDNWSPLVNPVFDSRTISNELQHVYGFKTELVENPTQDQVLVKLREYAEKHYEQLDQLFIFFAGHGFYDETFKEGFVVTKESLPSDPARSSYLAHSRIQSAVVNSPCEHVFLVMDVCFGGTIDQSEGSRNAEDQVYEEPSQSELILRKLQPKTRKYLTSGGKEYVSDGTKGKHSPFAKQFIAALKSRGGNDGILTLSELITYVETLKTAPQFGKFGQDKPGSEFLFIVK